LTGWTTGRLSGLSLLLAIMLVSVIGFAAFEPKAQAADPVSGTHLGVASCSGSTCHGRMVADGAIVRQDELQRWQEPSTSGGAHSRTYAVLSNDRSAFIARNLGIGSAQSSPLCLGCHAEPASVRGPRFQLRDGVGCEGCHGAASGWIASHYSVGASHQANVARGMIPLDSARARASVCLDCHYGSARTGQFVSHRIMAAGHPRISFELDLFSTLQQHHNEDADYVSRKGKPSNLTMWAVGQAMALERSLSLYRNPERSSEGVFPEFTFFDCHSCHRRIFDQSQPVKTGFDNPSRPIPDGMPPYNDENMIMLAAAARVAAPELAGGFDAATRNFHAALGKDRSSAIAAAARLSDSALALASAFERNGIGSGEAFAMIGAISGAAIAPRFTDYEGSVQAVMAVDTLLSSLVKEGTITLGAAAGIRGEINKAYAAVRDPNEFRPIQFRTSLGAAARSIRALQ
jgi:Cytochrome c554 and c-prime